MAAQKYPPDANDSIGFWTSRPCRAGAIISLRISARVKNPAARYKSSRHSCTHVHIYKQRDGKWKTCVYTGSCEPIKVALQRAHYRMTWQAFFHPKLAPRERESKLLPGSLLLFRLHERKYRTDNRDYAFLLLYYRECEKLRQAWTFLFQYFVFKTRKKRKSARYRKCTTH